MNASALSYGAPAATGAQLDLLDLSQFDGFGSLSKREQAFAASIFEGLTQRAAAARAGVTGSPEVLDQAGHTLMRNTRVQRLLAQAWAKSGASIHRTLAQAAHLQMLAYQQAVQADTAKVREAAMKQWAQCSTLIASIHGKLCLNVTGSIQHEHGGAVNVIHESALPALAAIRRAVLEERHQTINLPGEKAA